MIYCVIDIGSNTIRAVSFEIADDKIIQIQNKAVKSMLFDYTADGVLDIKGTQKLSEAVSYLCACVPADKYNAFATSAFRDIKNKGDVINYLKDINNIAVDVLEADEEAECDYLGICGEIESGIGIDLGGGSCQVMNFSETDRLFAKSMPIGTARLKNLFKISTLPTPEDILQIKNIVKSQLSTLGDIKQYNSMVAAGGSAKAVLKLSKASGMAENAGYMTSDDIMRVIGLCRRDDAEEFIKSIVGERYDTVIIGAQVMESIADYFGTKKIYVTKKGVRDGYIKKYMM